MDTIIIICNEVVVVSVKEMLQPLLLAKVTIVPDFDTGLKVVFERRPPVVFIQHEIAGVKGETVTRHIKSLLQGNSPRFIHMGKGPEDNAGRDFDDTIDLNLPEEEMMAAFRGCLEKVSAIRWKEPNKDDAESEWPDAARRETEIESSSQGFGVFDKSEPSESFAFEGSNEALHWPELDEFQTQEAITSSIPPALSVIPSQEDEDNPVIAAIPAPVPPSASLPSHVLQAVVQPPPAHRVETPPPHSSPPLPVPAPAISGEVSPRFDLNNNWLDEPFENEPPFPVEMAATGERRIKVLRLVLAGVVVAVLGGAVSYLLLRPSPPPQEAPSAVTIPAPVPKPVAVPLPQAATKDVPPPASKLPSFIPVDGKDPTYTTTHPGWERFTSPQREFLLFRENGAIKALQIVAVQKGMLDDGYLSRVLLEFCGDANCTILSRKISNGYVVEQGQTPSRAEVLYYKKQGSGETRGVVIVLPPGNRTP